MCIFTKSFWFSNNIFVYIYVYLSICRSDCLIVDLSLSIFRSICLSIYPNVYLSIYLALLSVSSSCKGVYLVHISAVNQFNSNYWRNLNPLHPSLTSPRSSAMSYLSIHLSIYLSIYLSPAFFYLPCNRQHQH